MEELNTGHMTPSEQDRYLRLLEDTARVLEPHGTALSVNHWHSIMHADLGKRITKRIDKRIHRRLHSVFLDRQTVKGQHGHPHTVAGDAGARRQAQRDAARRLDRVWVVPAIDLSLYDFIHNSAQSPAGARRRRRS